MSVTIKDIAKKAGVNPCVISHVLRDDAYARTLRQSTREKILQIVRDTGYVRNAHASATRTGTVKLIAYITVHSPEAEGNMIVHRDISGILARATEAGYGVKIYSDKDLKKSFEDIISHRISYVIAASGTPDEQEYIREQCEKNFLHLVWINQQCGPSPVISSDNEGAIIDTVEHLSSLGHKRIAYLYSGLTAFSARERHKGFLAGMEKCGLSPEGLTEGDPDFMNAGKSFLPLPPEKRPTAFICETCGRALAVLRNVQDAGLRVPEDISIACYGYGGEVMDFIRPDITCTRDDPFAIGSGAVDLILGQERKDFVQRGKNLYTIPSLLMKKGSTAPPPPEEEKEKAPRKILSTGGTETPQRKKLFQTRSNDIKQHKQIKEIVR